MTIGRSVCLFAAIAVLSSCGQKAPTVVTAPPTEVPAASPTPTAAATSSAPVTTSPQASASARPAAEIERIGVIVLENHEYDKVIGNPDAPYINALADRSALATNYYATTHPSLPNYLSMIAGDTFGVKSNCTVCHFDKPNLAAQMSEAHIPWRAYMEDMPSPCFQGPSFGRYAKKHDPFMYFDNITKQPGRCRNVVPLTSFDADQRTKAKPDFLWITPNLCNDMHDCGVKTGDDFMRTWGPKMLNALGPHGLLVVTFDEGSTNRGCCSFAAGGKVVTIVAGPMARPGRYDEALDHFSLLRTIQDAWGLTRLGRAAAPETRSMTELLKIS